MEEHSLDVWNDFLQSQQDAKGKLEVAKDVQEQVVPYIKTQIDAGVSNGKTSLPSHLMEYIYCFPEEMRKKLREYAENVLDKDSENGAAAKFLAIEILQQPDGEPIPIKPKHTLLEKAMVLVLNDVEICFFAFKKYGLDQFLFEVEKYDDETLVAIERLLRRIYRKDNQIQYRWARMLFDYSEVWTSPTDIYKILDENDPHIKRWAAVLRAIQVIFEQHLKQTPDNRDIVRLLTDIHDTLGNPDKAEKVLKNAQTVFEKQLEQDENNWNALNGLVNIHERLGNIELAHGYAVKANINLG